MKHNWEYKKIGDICIPKKNIQKASNRFDANDDILYIDISSIDNKSQCLTSVTNYIMSEAPSRAQQCVKSGDIIVSTVRPNLKNIAIVNKNDNNLVASSGFCVLRPNNIERNYLFHYITSDKFTNHLMSLTNGANYPAVRDNDILESTIPVPPLPTQQAIVSELDTLSGIIAECKETLKDYDALEQSIFYDMFGDPVKNEKGWEVKKLGEICTFKNGVNFSKNDKGTQYKFIGVSDFQDKKEIQARELDSILIEEKISEEYYLKDGDIVFVRSNGSKSLVGRNVLVHIQDEVVIFSGFCIRARLHDKQMTPLFLLHILKSDGIKSQISNSGRGCNISNLNQKILDSINVIKPPLPLQQDFATKIEAIEQMKAETKEALQEAETLFQARMDYWFN